MCTQLELILSLSDTRCRAIKPTNKDQMLSDGNGLYLRIRASVAKNKGTSKKTWVVRKSLPSGSKRKYSIINLGVYPKLSIVDARRKAAEVLCKGVSVATIKHLVEKYMSEVVEPTHKRHGLVQGYMNRAVIPQIGNRKVRDVSRSELVNLIQQYSKRGARTADQLRSNLKKLFSYAVELGLIDTNPMNDVTRRITGYIAISRDRVLSDEEIRMLWGLEHKNARVLRFLLLTGLRISEAQKGHREGDRWIVPANISKNARAHWVHITALAENQLPLPACSATNIQAWLRRLLDKQGIKPRFTPHDLRRTTATRMADIGVEPFIIERVLNHTLEGVMAVYNRAEYASERIDAAIRLEKYLNEILEGDLVKGEKDNG